MEAGEGELTLEHRLKQQQVQQQEQDELCREFRGGHSEGHGAGQGDGAGQRVRGETRQDEGSVSGGGGWREDEEAEVAGQRHEGGAEDVEMGAAAGVGGRQVLHGLLPGRLRRRARAVGRRPPVHRPAAHVRGARPSDNEGRNVLQPRRQDRGEVERQHPLRPLSDVPTGDRLVFLVDERLLVEKRRHHPLGGHQDAPPAGAGAAPRPAAWPARGRDADHLRCVEPVRSPQRQDGSGSRKYRQYDQDGPTAQQLQPSGPAERLYRSATAPSGPPAAAAAPQRRRPLPQLCLKLQTPFVGPLQTPCRHSTPPHIYGSFIHLYANTCTFFACVSRGGPSAPIAPRGSFFNMMFSSHSTLYGKPFLRQ